MDFERFEAVTFDCYGTLIDWEAGILAALRGVLGDRFEHAGGDDAVLGLFGRFEPEAEAGTFRPYRDVLADVAEAIAGELGLSISPAAAAAFAASVSTWPPFDDSPAALRKLGERYRLAVVSNVDDDLFRGSAEQLGIDFDEVVTASQVESYKPAHAHFHEVRRRLGVPTDRILHVAQSRYHDIAPASELGFSSVWVDRRGGRVDAATPYSGATPDLTVPDLTTLVRLVERMADPLPGTSA